VNCWISVVQGDWNGVLGQVCSANVKTPALKPFGIQALGELGRIDEMIATYASAESTLSPKNLLFCRLFVLAFSGRVEGVRVLLSRQLRFLRARDKAYWIVIANRAAAIHHEDARRVLASHARTTDDETFRRRAERILEAAPGSPGPALSAESRATIVAIENALLMAKRG
jgi:hypothetical protein